MKVKDVVYIGSFVSVGTFPSGRGPEFVFVGRSNVGKSSLINTLVARRNIARTSNAPGKTRAANFYWIDNSFCFVDVPGYGYAQVSRAERSRWRKLITACVTEREPLRGVVHLLDIRHKPSVEDREVSKLIHDTGKPVCFVFNKIDKVKHRDVEARIARHLEVLVTDPASAVVAFSADTGAGKRIVWAWLQDRLSS
jgi:GTP-binding protein